MTRNVKNDTAQQKLEEIQEEKRVICEPRYHEFHRNIQQYGFSKITIPKVRIG